QYSFQGRRFDIQRDGRITFRGGRPVDPGLDIWAERIIQGIQAQVHLHGTARDPELSLASKPPLDEGDILALIIFNQPASQLGQGQTQTLAESAGGLAAGIVVSPLAQSLGSALNIDLFEVQTTDEAGNIAPSVVLGEQVGEALFVKFRQQFGSQQVSEFLLEYQLADYLRWRSSVAEGEGVGRGANRSLIQRVERYGMDLIFYFAY
ncbi:MAG: translocation/assembly module TamB domain-containing protein, partial [Vicinamibacteraceae bacterium]